MEAWGALSVLYYFEGCLRVYRGRSLPVLYDVEIASRSQGRGKQGSAPRASTTPSFDDQKGQDASTRDDPSKALSHLDDAVELFSELLEVPVVKDATW
eukprot:5035525-Prymnesium_polylepis.1